MLPYRRGAISFAALLSLTLVTLALPLVTASLGYRREVRKQAGDVCPFTGAICSEVYPAPCTTDGLSGTKICQKRGVCACAGDGTCCTWGAGSSCESCAINPTEAPADCGNNGLGCLTDTDCCSGYCFWDGQAGTCRDNEEQNQSDLFLFIVEQVVEMIADQIISVNILYVEDSFQHYLEWKYSDRATITASFAEEVRLAVIDRLPTELLSPSPTPTLTPTVTPTPTPMPTNTPTITPLPTNTPSPSTTPTPKPTNTPTATSTPWLTPTPAIVRTGCNQPCNYIINGELQVCSDSYVCRKPSNSTRWTCRNPQCDLAVNCICPNSGTSTPPQPWWQRMFRRSGF